MNDDCEKNQNIPLLADFLRILSEENRLKIICLLISGEKCVCEIMQYLNIAQNLTSHHLKMLKDFNLLNSKKEGLNIYYSINLNELKKYKEIFNKVI
jgi:ArsR family transcriptional regulator